MGNLACPLCCHSCKLAPGESGKCGVRRNRDGRLDLPFEGVIAALSVDPMEKKPLYHFLPGSPVFSVGFFGCSMDCPFCQNHTIAKHLPGRRESSVRLTPKALVDRVLDSGCRSLAYTYSEPLVHFEYVLACAKTARSAGLKNVLVTNGNLKQGPAATLLPWIDAANIDLKSMDSAYYRDVLGGDFDTVSRFIHQAAEMTRVELTSLLVPGDNDSDESLAALADFVANLPGIVPLHVSAYHPARNYTKASTDVGRLSDAVRQLRETLTYVYPGNVPGADGDTRCTTCDEVLVHRSGYRVTTNFGRGSACPSCGTSSPILIDP